LIKQGKIAYNPFVGIRKMSKPPTSGLSITQLVLLIIYISTNALFVVKYAPEYSLNPSVAVPGYLIFSLFLALAASGSHADHLSDRTRRILYFGLTVAGAVGLTILMLRFDPANIAVGRYPALHDWIEKLLDGEFPYLSGVRPSGFPFLFIMAMPFYFIGDLGLWQIFGFLLFSYLVLSGGHNGGGTRIRSLLLLLAAPIFLYEVVVRSELFSNMVIVLAYLEFARRRIGRAGILGLVLTGFVGGLLLSTRGIVVLIYIIFFGYYFRKNLKEGIIFGISALASFCLTLVPFMIWNWNHFANSGPFSVQLLYIPGWLLLLSVLASVLCAVFVRSVRQSYYAVSLVLFTVVLTVFLLSVLRIGWTEAVSGDGFDISYFCFTLPYLLYAMCCREDAPALHRSAS
jgi:hypothetical protein